MGAVDSDLIKLLMFSVEVLTIRQNRKSDYHQVDEQMAFSLVNEEIKFIQFAWSNLPSAIEQRIALHFRIQPEWIYRHLKVQYY